MQQLASDGGHHTSEHKYVKLGRDTQRRTNVDVRMYDILFDVWGGLAMQSYAGDMLLLLLVDAGDVPRDE